MPEILFLGTGPTGGTKNRTETSALIKTKQGNILIDATRDFLKQSKKIKSIEVVLITHGHIDAIGGIKKLDNFLKKKTPLYSHSQTIKKIKNKFRIKNLEFRILNNFKKRKILGTEVVPFLVRHSIQKSFPTFGFAFAFGLIYISDTGGWNKRVQKIIEKAKLLVLDGAMYKKKIKSHLEISEVLERLENWRIRKLVFTHLGKTVPQKLSLPKNVRLAFDNLRIMLK